MCDLQPTNPFSYSTMVAADLSTVQIMFNVDPRNQGLRYDLFNTDTKEVETVIFHDVYKRIKHLAETAITNGDLAALETIKAFIPNLVTAVKTGRNFYESDAVSCFYRFLTIICRIFGSTPCSGTHEERLTELTTLVTDSISKLNPRRPECGVQ